jgi:hypothetical protein
LIVALLGCRHQQEGPIKKLFVVTILALSAAAMPASAAPQIKGPLAEDLPPGCFQIFPKGPIFCLPMPIE